jgi:hypothetical protein
VDDLVAGAVDDPVVGVVPDAGVDALTVGWVGDWALWCLPSEAASA